MYVLLYLYSAQTYLIMEKKDLTLKSGNVLSNNIVSKVSDTYLLFETGFKDEKSAKGKVTYWLNNTLKSAKGDFSNSDVVRAYKAKIAADIEYQKQVSRFINEKFAADIIVSNIIANIGKMPDSEFFTPEYLDKLGIYKIPNGVILDTLQKCRSFVSSLYATALSEYKKEIKDGGGIEITLARVKEIIAFNDSQFIATKFAKMSILRKYELLYGVIANCTKSEKLAIWAKLGIKFTPRTKTLKSGKKANVLGDIPIEEYTPLPNKIDINFYHEFATNAVSLSKEDAAKVMSTPITPLKSAKGSAKPKSTVKGN